MPTGYTADVQDGKITDLRPFAMRCARAFGALITMRDSPFDAPIPPKLEPSTSYYDELIAQAQESLTRLPAMTPEECDAAAVADYERAIASWNERAQTRTLHRRRYEDMIGKVNAWHPPEAVMPLKDFMLEQLARSIDFDCDGKYDSKPRPITGAAWHQQQISDASRDLSYGLERRAEEIARVDGRNLWLDALRVSLA